MAFDWNKIYCTKSDSEKEYDEWCKKYSDKFGKQYGAGIFEISTFKEAIAEIKECINSGKPKQTKKVEDNIII